MKHPSLILQNRQSMHERPHAIWSCKSYMKNIWMQAAGQDTLLFGCGHVFFSHMRGLWPVTCNVSHATLSTPCDASTRMFLTDNTYSTTRYSPEKCCSLRHTVDTGYATTASTWMWRLACCVWVIVCNARMLSSVRRAVRRILCRSTRRASKRQRLLTICRHWQRVCCRRVCFSFHSQGRSLSAL